MTDNTCVCGEEQTDRVKGANYLGLQKGPHEESWFVWNCPRCGTTKMEENDKKRHTTDLLDAPPFKSN